MDRCAHPLAKHVKAVSFCPWRGDRRSSKGIRLRYSSPLMMRPPPRECVGGRGHRALRSMPPRGIQKADRPQMPIGSVMLHDAVQELKRCVAGATLAGARANASRVKRSRPSQGGGEAPQRAGTILRSRDRRPRQPRTPCCRGVAEEHSGRERLKEGFRGPPR